MKALGLLSVVSLCVSCLGQAQTTPTYTVSTFAGNGTASFAGDGGAAKDANINFPMNIAFDGAGNLFIADQFNHRIRKVTPDGVISTVAGNGTSGFSGDAAAATSAMLSFPCAVFVDGSNNLYIVDTGNRRIRKVSSTGTITTIAGTGDIGLAADGTKATDASITYPIGIVVDAAGNVLVSDLIDGVIRKIGTDGNISTFAGNGTTGFFGDGGAAVNAQFNLPDSLALDAAGNVYIADVGNHRIRKVATDGTISTIAGSGFTRGFAGDNGPATSAVLNYPYGVAVDSSGRVFIADLSNSRIRMIRTDGIIVTVAGNGTYGDQGDGGAARSAQFRFPHGVAVDKSGNVSVSDTQNSRIRRLTPNSVASSDSAPVLASTNLVRSGSDTWVEIYGWNLADSAGAKVNIGGQAAEVSYASPNQVNVKLPMAAPGSVDLTVTTSGGTSAPRVIVLE